MPEPGWYDDPQDPHLLRWFDGVQWTSHTGPRTAPTASHPAPRTPGQPAMHPTGGASSGVPNWLKVAGPPVAALVLLAVLALFVVGGDDSGGGRASTDEVVDPAPTTEPASSDVEREPSDREQEVAEDRAEEDALPPYVGDDGCPTIAETRQGHDLTVVARYGTDGFLVWICEGGDGSLTYHGQRRGGDASTDSLTLDATSTSNGFTASSGGSSFTVNDSYLRVVNSAGDRIVDDTVLASDP